MDKKQRAELIRKGNQAFNEGNIGLASDIFKAAEYRDGLIRVGDYWYYDEEKPLVAYGYYRLAKHEKMLGKIFESFTFALQCWLGADETEPRPKGPMVPNTQVGRDFLEKMGESPEA